MWWTYHLFLFYVLKVPIQTITKPKLRLLILQNSKSKLIQYWLFPNHNTHQTKNAFCMKIYVVKHLHWLININGLFVWTFGLEIQAIQLIWKLKNNFLYIMIICIMIHRNLGNSRIDTNTCITQITIFPFGLSHISELIFPETYLQKNWHAMANEARQIWNISLYV